MNKAVSLLCYKTFFSVAQGKFPRPFLLSFFWGEEGKRRKSEMEEVMKCD